MTNASHQVDAPELLYNEKHSVVTKWDKAEMEKIRMLAAQHNLKPGPFLTKYFGPQIANMEVHDIQLQEALPIDQAS